MVPYGKDKCSHGSIECICPVCVTGSGPCHNVDDGSCTGYDFGSTCPLDHWECGRPGDRVSATPAPSTTPSLTMTRTPSATPSVTTTPSGTPSVTPSPSMTPSPSPSAPVCPACLP